MNLSERIQGSLGFGIMAAAVANVGYQVYGIEVPPAIMIGFFLCAAVPTFLFTSHQ